jgi:hypothetical protein
VARVDIKRDIKKNLLISGDVKRDLYCKRLSEFKFIIQNRPSLLLQTFCFFYLPEQGIPVKLPLNPITEFCILPTMFQNTMLPKITVGFPLQGISVFRASLLSFFFLTLSTNISLHFENGDVKLMMLRQVC